MSGLWRRWWAAGVASVVAAAAGAVLISQRPDFVDASGGQEDALPAAVRASLTAKVRDAIEGGASAHLASGRGGGLAVRVLGTDPPSVTRVADARTVYAWAMCASVGTAVQTESSLPVAVRLTVPPTAEVPGDGSRYGPDLQRIFPERLWDLLSGGAYVDELEPQLRQRVRERS